MQQTSQPRDPRWDWLDEPRSTDEPLLLDPAAVTAVMVVHNAAEWLPRQLLSLARLDPRPGRILAVDNGSTDTSRALLEGACAEGVLDGVVAGDAGLGFGEAVALALGEDRPAWLWLLHDDAAPRRDALGQLLRGAGSTGAAVVLPKLLQPARRNYPDTLSELGQSVARSGRRIDLVDVGDIDQLQETARPVLGGSTAGMLVSGEVWRELGGLAPELPLHRDGVDLGWRAGQAGHLVTTWPDAALTHRQAGRSGDRPTSFGSHPHEADRLAGLRLVAARGGNPPPRAWLSFQSWLRALAFLLGKSPATAAAELRALRRFRRDPAAVSSLRARAAGDGDVTALLPGPGRGLRSAVDRISNAFGERYREWAHADPDTSLDELTTDEYGREPQTSRLSPVLLLVCALAAAALAAGRTLLAPGTPAGGGLLDAPRSLAQAWSGYLTPDVGVAGAGAPWQGVAAALSTLALGNPAWLTTVWLLVVPLLAALTALTSLRRLGVRRPAAVAGALTWAGATILLGLVTAGDISGMALAVVGPLLARSSHAVVTDQRAGADALRAPAGVAFWGLLAGAFWPVALVLLTVAALVWAARGRGRWWRALVAVGPPWLFLAPWLPTLLRWPGRLLTGADPMAWPTYPPASSAMLAGRILPSGLPLWANLVFFVCLGLAALYGLAQLDTRARLLTGVAVAVPLLAGVLVSRIEVGVNGGAVRPLLSGWALLVVAALLVPALRGQARRSDGDPPPAADLRVVATGLTLAGVLAAGVWGWFGFRGPVQPSPSVLPGYVSAVVDSPRDSRVLMLQLVDGGLRWNVVEQQQPQWGSGEHNPVQSFSADFARIVQALSSGSTPEKLADELTDLGVSHVWMRGFGEDRLAAISNASGLTRAPADDHTVVWTVAATPSRAAVLEGGRLVPVLDGQVPDGGPRQLRLAEEPDGRWRVLVGGQQLTATSSQPPVFRLDAGQSGELTHGLRPSWGALAWQVLVLLLVATLAAPTLGSGSTARREAA